MRAFRGYPYVFGKKVINQGMAKACAIISTSVYLVLFFPFCWMAFFWLAATEPSKAQDLVTSFSWFWTPVSIPISVYSMWISYRMKNYKRVFLWCSLPLLVFGAFIFINVIERM